MRGTTGGETHLHPHRSPQPKPFLAARTQRRGAVRAALWLGSWLGGLSLGALACVVLPPDNDKPHPGQDGRIQGDPTSTDVRVVEPSLVAEPSYTDHVLVDGAVERVFALREGGFVAASDDEIFVEVPGSEGQRYPRQECALVAAAALDGGRVLIACEAGLFIPVGGQLAPSPLASAIEGTILDVAAGRAADSLLLWLATSDALYRWRAGSIDEVRFNDAALAGSALRVDAEGGVWVLSGKRLLSLRSDGAVRVAYELTDAPESKELALDERGHLWVRLDDALYRREPEGTWSWIRFAEPVDQIAASPRAAGAWVRLGQSLVHATTDGFRQLTGTWTATLSAASEGGLFVADDGGLRRLEGGRVILFWGLAVGATVSTPQLVTLAVPDREELETLEVRLDDEEVEVDAASAEVSLDPSEMSAGLRRLTVHATYAGALPALSGELAFQVGQLPAPTWRNDIQPLFETRCAHCHGPTGGAHPLYESRMWRDDIERIVPALREGRMPTSGALPDSEVELVERWRITGMQE